MRSVATALGARQNRRKEEIRFIGKPLGAHVEIVGMPLSANTFVVYLHFPTLIKRATNFADIVGDQ